MNKIILTQVNNQTINILKRFLIDYGIFFDVKYNQGKYCIEAKQGFSIYKNSENTLNDAIKDFLIKYNMDIVWKAYIKKYFDSIKYEDIKITILIEYLESNNYKAILYRDAKQYYLYVYQNGFNKTYKAASKKELIIETIDDLSNRIKFNEFIKGRFENGI